MKPRPSRTTSIQRTVGGSGRETSEKSPPSENSRLSIARRIW
ncbi:unnamed protein product [Cyprideis torosa]|uniref:Uncharacterized protein n=1 Tax=Cyprideis torosa TaxID=163714 RepID=A0A7R8WVZ4_9CRUS|nr:unnamed protein product [Cyprideis torosa]CAG0907915.1 unnamed protein product [Cyprideis torosa]